MGKPSAELALGRDTIILLADDHDLDLPQIGPSRFT